MSAFSEQLSLNLRLHLRNTMALIYGYLFPTIFLFAFWALYRYDQVPLVRHMGELLTITVLGGACFGLPTTMVGERERGVWRRYRLTPVSTLSLVLSTVAARYVLLIVAGLLQVALAMGLGMPLPRHVFDLWVAFTLVSFAFLGLGLLIAMLADNVPAVQALGQCLFLPMLIVGGVAVPLTSLPPWAEHVSAFLPGRYAVEAIQASVTGAGLAATRFSLVALAGIGAAGCLAGAKLFRWDRDQRFAALEGKGWVAVALAAWAAVGIAAESRGRVAVSSASVSTVLPSTVIAPPVAPGPAEPPTQPEQPVARMTPAERAIDTGRPVAAPAKPPASVPTEPPASASTRAPGGPAAPAQPPTGPPPPVEPPIPASWQAVTLADIDRDLTFDRLPLDRSVVTPIATADQPPDADVADQVAALAETLMTWAPGLVSDRVQQARNFLYVLGMHDVAQTPLEAYIPAVVFARMLQEMPRAELIQVLYWIALHPDQGALLTTDDARDLQMRGTPTDEAEIRNRAAIYAVKLLGRLTNHIK